MKNVDLPLKKELPSRTVAGVTDGVKREDEESIGLGQKKKLCVIPLTTTQKSIDVVNKVLCPSVSTFTGILS